jgi:hypothetical protein
VVSRIFSTRVSSATPTPTGVARDKLQHFACLDHSKD